MIGRASSGRRKRSWLRHCQKVYGCPLFVTAAASTVTCRSWTPSAISSEANLHWRSYASKSFNRWFSSIVRWGEAGSNEAVFLCRRPAPCNSFGLQSGTQESHRRHSERQRRPFLAVCPCRRGEGRPRDWRGCVVDRSVIESAYRSANPYSRRDDQPPCGRDRASSRRPTSFGSGGGTRRQPKHS